MAGAIPSATASITPTRDLSNILDVTAGGNVDPGKLSGCLGEDLKKATGGLNTMGSSRWPQTRASPRPDPKIAESVFDWHYYYDNAQDW